MDRAPKGVPAMCCSVCPLAGVAWAAVTRHSVVLGEGILMIQFSCSNCGRSMSAPYSAAGTFGQCPNCGTVGTVPLPVWNAQASGASAPSTAQPIFDTTPEGFPRFDDEQPTSTRTKRASFLGRCIRGSFKLAVRAVVAIVGLVCLIAALLAFCVFWDDQSRRANQAPANANDGAQHNNDRPQDNNAIGGGKQERDSTPRGYVTVGGHLASPSEELLDKALRYVNDEDEEALLKLMATGAVVELKSGVHVELARGGFRLGKVKIRPRGKTLELWTFTEAIKPAR